MAGTIAGGKAAAIKNKANDPDFYKKIALLAQLSWRMNGRKPRGFAYSHDLAVTAGKIGGTRSRRKSKIARAHALATNKAKTPELVIFD